MSEGRARVGGFDNATDLACLMHHYGGAHTVIITHTRYYYSS